MREGVEGEGHMREGVEGEDKLTCGPTSKEWSHTRPWGSSVRTQRHPD